MSMRTAEAVMSVGLVFQHPRTPAVKETKTKKKDTMNIAIIARAMSEQVHDCFILFLFCILYIYIYMYMILISYNIMENIAISGLAVFLMRKKNIYIILAWYSAKKNRKISPFAKMSVLNAK